MFRKLIFVGTVLFLFFISASGQITKGFWMFGGNGSLRSGTFSLPGNEFKSTQINIQPRVGFFPSDKFATGILLNYSFNRNKQAIGPAGSASTFGVGPFVRYYLLSKEKQVNLLAEANGLYNWQTGSLNSKSGQTEYSIVAGPAIFLNTSVAVEILTGYRYSKETQSNGSLGKEFLIQIGLQVYLERAR
ncbi:MAG: hypothetical protein K2X48_12710 [Chitinophagaceae bacterium]|nr:hypothetical protein [Chitinophagaceae bacterium]